MSNQNRPRWWSQLNSPLSDHAADMVGSLGLLVFGLSGFIDLADGRTFSLLKGSSLVAGVVSLAIVIARRIRSKRGK